MYSKTRISAWISKNPTIAFYLLCFTISWGLWLPAILDRSPISEILAMVGLLGGPGFACIIVARQSAIVPNTDRRTPYKITFPLAWAACSLIIIVYQRTSSPLTPVAANIIFVGLAAVPAIIIASAFSGRPGVRATLSTLAHPRGWWGWYLLALVLPPIIRLSSAWLSNLLGWGFLNQPETPADLMEWISMTLVIFLYTIIYAGGLNEETGWTGFALPRLQAKTNPLVATILVWALWMLWHVPLHSAGYFNLSPHVLIGSLFGRFLMTWLFIRSSGGILTALILHSSVNVTSQFVPVTNASLLVEALLAILVIVGGRMWKRLPPNSPAVTVEEHVLANTAPNQMGDLMQQDGWVG